MRTPAFKAWFGDWENVYRRQQLDAFSVNVETEEIVAGMKTKEVLELLKPWMQEELPAQVNKNVDGRHMSIDIDEKSIKKA